jgi:hypothetical protein
MFGDWVVDVLRMQPVSIHGDLYYEVLVVRTDEAGDAGPDAGRQGVVLRVPQHTIASPPETGQRLKVTFLMGQVTGAKAV